MNKIHVTSPEWSKRLKELGISQKSDYAWLYNQRLKKWDLVSKFKVSGDQILSAFLVDELFGILPNIIPNNGNIFYKKIISGSEIYNRAHHVIYSIEYSNDNYVLYTVTQDTFVNAIAAMVEHLRKEKII